MMARSGWFKAWREAIDNPLINKDPDHLSVYIHLLNNAAFEVTTALLGGKLVHLQPGQLTTGREQLAAICKVDASKVTRILNAFEKAGLIQQKTTSKNRLITIVPFEEWQESEQQMNSGNATATTVCGDSEIKSEQQMNNNRTTSEQQVNTLEEVKNKRNRELKHERERDFEKLWDMYPNKANRVRAEQTFYNLEDIEIDTLLIALEKQKRLPQWQDPNFIPILANWLKERRWEDVLPEADALPPKRVYRGFSEINGELIGVRDCPDFDKKWAFIDRRIGPSNEEENFYRRLGD